MNIKECRETYYEHSGTTSSLVRQLGLVGIALIWIFKVDIEGIQKIPDELIPAGFLIVISLSMDFLQYSIGALIWGAYARCKENSEVDAEEEFEAPAYINWPALLFFWGKAMIMSCAYYLLLQFLWTRLT